MRAGRTQRRCAGVIDAAGLARGEMGEDSLDDQASSLRERHFRGGESGDEVDGVEYDMSGPVTEGVLESIHDLRAVIDREAFVRERWAGDVAAQAFEGVALMGSAARADPRLHHSGGRWRENPESWAMQGLDAGGWDATVCRVRALRPAWGPVAMR